ncbi:hypothetical protein ACTCUF_05480 [Lactococcus lactis]|uniref:hypothetical protein n=1 Tax=Lactococcus lactis TaxID=1358 RepID=UPI003F84434C
MKKLTKRQFAAIGAVAVLIIGGVSFALVKHNETDGVKTNASSLKSSSKKEMTSKTSAINESQKSSSSQTSSSSQEETTQSQLSVDTKNLTENQFEQWVAITQSNQMQDTHPLRITVSKSDNNLYQAKIDYTATRIDSVNSYKVNSSGELEAIDFEHYPAMKVVSQSFPEIKQNQLTTNQINIWVVAVQDVLFEQKGLKPGIDVVYDLETVTDGSIANVKAFKIDYTPSVNGGADNANKTLINEFRINSDGNLEIKDVNSETGYRIISKVYMDTSMVQ